MWHFISSTEEPCQPIRRVKAQVGVTLVELMVAMLMALIVTLAMTETFIQFEQHKRNNTGASQSHLAGNITGYLLERELRNGGFGLTTARNIDCVIKAKIDGKNVDLGKSVPIQLIELPGTSSAADSGENLFSIVITGSTSGNMNVPLITLGSWPDASASLEKLSVPTNAFFRNGDLLLLLNEARDFCPLTQVTGVPTDDRTVLMMDTSSSWNFPVIADPSKPFATGSLVMNLGSLQRKEYFINRADATLRVKETSARFGPGVQERTAVVAGGVVGLVAQYGRDKDADGLISASEWFSVDPTTSKEWHEVIAVRFAVAVRSANQERPDADGKCKTTIADNRPRWAGGVVPIIDPLPSCSRYMVFETAVPIRNQIWRQE